MMDASSVPHGSGWLQKIVPCRSRIIFVVSVPRRILGLLMICSSSAWSCLSGVFVVRFHGLISSSFSDVCGGLLGGAAVGHPFVMSIWDNNAVRKSIILIK